MDIKQIYQDIAYLLKIVEGWSAGGDVSDIERDIALDKIKGLYEQIRFSSPVTPSLAPPEEEESRELEVEVELTYYEGEDEEIAEEEIAEEEIAEEEIAEESEEEVEEEEDVEEVEEEPLIPFDLVDVSIIPEADETAETEAETEAEEPQPITPIENALFDITTIPIQQKSRRSAILSLYSDEEVSTPTPTPTPTPAPTPTPTPAPRTHSDSKESANDLEIVEITIDEPTAVTTIADRYAEQMASSSSVSSGASSSINDRYIISQELFGGDMQACEEMLMMLEKIDNFDDSMIYIIENYDWDPGCEAAKLVVQMLEQRFLS